MPFRVPCDGGLNRGITCRHAAWTAGWLSGPESPGYHPGLLGPRASSTQKAPGGSRGTPGCMPFRVPCDGGLNRGITCRHAAWTAVWLSGPESPGCHPGLLGPRASSTQKAPGGSRGTRRSEAAAPEAAATVARRCDRPAVRRTLGVRRDGPSLRGPWMAPQAYSQSSKRTSRISNFIVPAGTSIDTFSPTFFPSRPWASGLATLIRPAS